MRRLLRAPPSFIPLGTFGRRCCRVGGVRGLFAASTAGLADRTFDNGPLASGIIRDGKGSRLSSDTTPPPPLFWCLVSTLPSAVFFCFTTHARSSSCEDNFTTVKRVVLPPVVLVSADLCIETEIVAGGGVDGSGGGCLGLIRSCLCLSLFLLLSCFAATVYGSAGSLCYTRRGDGAPRLTGELVIIFVRN